MTVTFTDVDQVDAAPRLTTSNDYAKLTPLLKQIADVLGVNPDG